MTDRMIWLYGESMMYDPPGKRVAFGSREQAKRHARERAEEYANKMDEEPPVWNEYESWFGYSTNNRSFQVWPISYYPDQ